MTDLDEGRPTYMALLRDADGSERSVPFESMTGQEAAVGDEITVEGAEWRVMAVYPGNPPVAGTLICERAELHRDDG
jgi:hypothetical protein